MPLKTPNRLLVIGSPYFIDSTIKNYVAKYPEYEETTYFADELNIEDFFLNINTRNIFSEGKLIILRKTDLLKKTDEVVKAISASNESTVLLCFESDKKAETFQKNVTGTELTIIFEDKKADNTKVIVDIFKTHQIDITDQMAIHIAMITQNDLSLINSEAEKLSLYFNQKKPESNQQILNLILGTEENTIFDFTKYFLERSPSHCYKILNKLTDENIKTLYSVLFKSVTSLYLKFLAPTLNTAKNPLFENKDYFIRGVNANFQKWTVAESKKLVELYAETDLQQKTGKIDTLDSLLLFIGVMERSIK